ncbi:MAG: 1-deoxy-D-xylulose-5-phosphate reductoisomerase [Solirubrobacterales bacterium]
MLKKIAILGSTGSIGEQALDVIRKNPDQLKVVALAAGGRVDRLIEQAAEFKVGHAVIGDITLADRLKVLECRTGSGAAAVAELGTLPEVDVVLVAVTGAAGILPTLNAVKAGKVVALANKESLVAAGSIIMPLARKTGAQIIPVDSEHSAIFQCLQGEEPYAAALWLTASGGPFRTLDLERFVDITPEMALRHPKWNMGPKISIDSATLMNKGLEVIEAHHLFGMPYDRIQVVVHPESIVHSLVEFDDGAFLAHLGLPDMRIPIQYAFSYPARWNGPGKRMNLFEIKELHFEEPNLVKFPALRIAFEAGGHGGTLPAVMNAANEIAVDAFLQGDLAFHRIVYVVEEVMGRHIGATSPGIEDIFEADYWARTQAEQMIARMR